MLTGTNAEMDRIVSEIYQEYNQHCTSGPGPNMKELFAKAFSKGYELAFEEATSMIMDEVRKDISLHTTRV